MKSLILIVCISIFMVISVKAETTNFWIGIKSISGNCTNGYGTVEWMSGKTYEGYFENNLPNGFGNLFDPDSGESYFGEFKNGLKNGIGVIDGTDVQQFMNGKAVGAKIRFVSNGDIYISKGTMNDLHKKGTSLVRTPDKQIMEAEEYVEYFTTNRLHQSTVISNSSEQTSNQALERTPDGAAHR